MKVSPSLLAANFANLEPDIRMINESDADYLYLDVMDGVFVPNISFGFPVMKDVAKICCKAARRPSDDSGAAELDTCRCATWAPKS